MKHLLLVAVALSLPLSALAECRKKCVCDDNNRNCKVQQICQSKFDLPSIEVDPICYDTNIRAVPIKPLEQPMQVAPLNTTHCQLKLVNGRWQNVCQ